MELLVVTLAHIAPGNDVDTPARIRFVIDSLRSAAGLITTRCYRSRGSESYYFILTTWDDEESWQRAQERHNPKLLLMNSASSILNTPPEQWSMHYLWGYSRPSHPPVLAAIHLATMRTDQADYAQHMWLKELREHIIEPSLAFAFLARGAREDSLNVVANLKARAAAAITTPVRGPVIMSFFSWANENERETFYAHPGYQAINKFISGISVTRTFPLEPF